MKKYVLVTDSGSDLSTDILKRWSIISLPLSFKFDGENELSDYDITPEVFIKRYVREK